LQRGDEVVASDRKVVSPTYVPDLVQGTLDLLLDEETGLWHVTNKGAVSWHDLACEAADWAKLDRSRIRIPDNEEPADTSMTSERGVILRSLDGGLNDFFDHSEPLRLFA
jgi:dTDP-4-dehydrorhamnose reductase